MKKGDSFGSRASSSLWVYLLHTPLLHSAHLSLLSFPLLVSPTNHTHTHAQRVTCHSVQHVHAERLQILSPLADSLLPQGNEVTLGVTHLTLMVEVTQTQTQEGAGSADGPVSTGMSAPVCDGIRLCCEPLMLLWHWLFQKPPASGSVTKHAPCECRWVRTSNPRAVLVCFLRVSHTPFAHPLHTHT